MAAVAIVTLLLHEAIAIDFMETRWGSLAAKAAKSKIGNRLLLQGSAFEPYLFIHLHQLTTQRTHLKNAELRRYESALNGKLASLEDLRT